MRHTLRVGRTRLHDVRRCVGVAVALATWATSAAAQRTVASDVPPRANAPRADELLARTVTMKLVGVSRVRAINELAARARVVIQYRAAALEAYGDRVTVNVNRVALRDALQQVLAGTTLVVVTDRDGQIGIVGRRADRVGPAQGTGVVTGVVVDSATGQGLAGVTVAVQGLAVRSTTTAGGAFRLAEVPAGAQALTARRLGYRQAVRAVDVPAGDSVRVRLGLAQAPTALSGVVTTASGQQRKLEVGNDITTLDVDSVMRTAPVATLTDLLETRVPGLTVQRTSGSPGDPSRIRLRGASSITGSNDPIVVVDGIRVFADQTSAAGNLAGGRVHRTGLNGLSTTDSIGYARPSPLDQIDPNSVEKVEVMKGPSAAALYGSDAANGVIVITTKRGKAGPTRWSLTLNQGRTASPRAYPVNHFPFASTRWGTRVPCDGLGGRPIRLLVALGRCALDSMVTFQALNDPALSPTTGHGTDRSAALTVSGGTGAVTYSVTGSAADRLGALKLPAVEAARFRKFHTFEPPGWMTRPDRYAAWGATSRLDFQLGPSGQGGMLGLTNQLQSSRQQRSSLDKALAALQRTYVDRTQLEATPLVGEYYERVIASTLTSTNAVTLHYPLWRGVPLDATAGVNVTGADDQALTPRNYITVPGPDTLGQVTRGQGTTLVKTLNVSTQLPDVHTVGRVALRTAVGLNLLSQASTTVTSTTKGLAVGSESQGIGTVFQGIDVLTGTSGTQASVGQTTYGWYVEPQLDFGSRVFANPGIRFDGGSNSGAHAGTTPFPKLNLSWIAVDRAGARPLWGAVTQLRPRVALGLAGQQPAPGAKLRLLRNAAGVVQLGGASEDLVRLSTLGNTQLRPERGRELEGGVDATLWEGRASVALTAARKLRLDAIQEVSVAPSATVTGLETYSVNVGTVRGTSVEAEATLDVLRGRRVAWSVNGQVTHQTNVVTRLAPGFRADKQLGIVAGYPLFSRWARPILGVQDLDGNGTVSYDEVLVGDTAVYVGQQAPTYEATASTQLVLFGRVSVNTAVAYTRGATQSNLGEQGSLDWLYNDPAAPLARQAAALVSTPGAYTGGVYTPYGLIQTVNTLRWQSLSVRYETPAALARRLGVGSLSVALQGSNLGLKTNYRGVDPNVNVYPGGDQTADTGQLPVPRLWQLSVRLGH